MKQRKKKGQSFCSVSSQKKGAAKNRNAFYRHKGNFRWQGISDAPYKNEGGDWSAISRRELIGSHGESTKFHVRYFEISPKGFSSPEQHGHEHVIICVKGSGMVLTGRTKRSMSFMDTIYIAPNTPHQLSNPYTEPFGFLCMVNARRDKPKPLP
jgi:ribulose-bisphosphate carboxylase large chain